MGDSIYVNADYALALNNGAEVNFHVGSYTGDFAAWGTTNGDLMDYSVSVSKDNFTFGVSKTSFENNPNNNSQDSKFFVAYNVDFSL